MFFDKTILSVSHTNLLQTFIILSLASIGPSKERPYVLLYPFETRWEWYPHLSHTLEFSYTSITFLLARKTLNYNADLCYSDGYWSYTLLLSKFDGTAYSLLW